MVVRMVMQKTTVYLPRELKADLERMAAETGKSEADLIREGIRLALAQQHRTPTIPIFVSPDPHFAERVDEHLKGFGER
jgi:Arc/MetJ-type ribon-helix-helix transcriptional regulator